MVRASPLARRSATPSGAVASALVPDSDASGGGESCGGWSGGRPGTAPTLVRPKTGRPASARRPYRVPRRRGADRARAVWETARRRLGRAPRPPWRQPAPAPPPDPRAPPSSGAGSAGTGSTVGSAGALLAVAGSEPGRGAGAGGSGSGLHRRCFGCRLRRRYRVGRAGGRFGDRLRCRPRGRERLCWRLRHRLRHRHRLRWRRWLGWLQGGGTASVGVGGRLRRGLGRRASAPGSVGSAVSVAGGSVTTGSGGRDAPVGSAGLPPLASVRTSEADPPGARRPGARRPPVRTVRARRPPVLRPRARRTSVRNPPGRGTPVPETPVPEPRTPRKAPVPDPRRGPRSRRSVPAPGFPRRTEESTQDKQEHAPK